MFFIPLYLLKRDHLHLHFFSQARQLGLEPESVRKDKLQTRSPKNYLYVRALNKLLITQAGDISPYFYENSLRLLVSNIRAKFSCHCQGTSKNN